MKQLEKAYIGVSAKNNLKKIIDNLSVKCIFLVRGKKSYELSESKQLIDSIIKQSKIKIIEFFDFSENPKEEDVLRGLNLLENQNVDLIIAIGGGSVIDMAKLIRFKYSYIRLQNDIYEKRKDIITLIAIPTTAGTGAETTRFAVLYKNNVKLSIAHPAILPDIAIVDPSFSYTTPPYLTACAGFDALAQGIEAYWSKNSTIESDEYAVKSIKLIYPNLPFAINNDLNARNNVSEGAYWAGKAINITKTTAPHACSYPFTSYYGIPHGHAVALTFPFFVYYNMNMPESEYKGKISFNVYIEKMTRLRNILKFKIGEESEKIKEYILSLGLFFKLPESFDKNIIINNINLERLDNNPRLLTSYCLLKEYLDTF